MTTPNIERLHSIKTLPQLLAYLRDDLDWPIEAEDVEELTFDYKPEEFGLDAAVAVRIKEIKQIRPLVGQQPWGIFWINFEKKRLPVVVMRRILRALVIKKRATAKAAERKAWLPSDLLFISAYGEDSDRAITFAHFVDQQNNNLAELRVLGWDDDDTPLKYDWIARTLSEKMRWQSAFEKDSGAWRNTWRAAFTLRHREVITTSQELALELAALAKRIRGRIRSILRMEDGMGQMRKLMRAFQQGLIHDLDDEGFADMFAQTVTYGLFSIAVRKTFPGEGTALTKDDVPNLIFTSPFLKEMLGVFLGLKSRKGKIDFDELGLSDVTDLLQSPNTHMEAILRDFGNRTKQEDPVIHFYEHFLTAYDKAKKIQRGVFYTPQPVVSYIVRSVHELLRSEFGLEDGLASTITWGEMVKRNPGLKLPILNDELGDRRTIATNEPFVQILDPATGTGTFLVEAIDVIHKTLTAKWGKQGKSKAEILKLWNEYVPHDLLPRLYGYELMMAPYAIAHMKLGLKLSETGYRFATEERARIYLTNSLEPKVTQLPHIAVEALAHEAASVNDIKWNKRFTVIIGNPPYSEKSKNEGNWIGGLMERYKTTIRSEEAQIKTVSNDYVKFLCLIQHTAELSGTSIIGVITSNGYLDGRLFRDMRRSWIGSYSLTNVLNLHGSGRRGDAADDDENVFEILQGVCIAIARRMPIQKTSEVRYSEMLGSSQSKCERLLNACAINGAALAVSEPLFLFVPSSKPQTIIHTRSLSSIFGTGDPTRDRNRTYAGGFKTRQDSFTVAFDERILRSRISELADNSISESSLREKYGLCSTAHFEFKKARRAAQDGSLESAIRRVKYRPFDDRPMIWAREVLCEPQTAITRHLLQPNICLATSRVVKDDAFRHVAVALGPLEVISLSNSTSTNAYMFPLYRYEPDPLFGIGKNKVTPIVNLSREYINEMVAATGMPWNESFAVAENANSLSPISVFYYIYAILHSPKYRVHFSDELLRDFPPIPLPCCSKSFCAIAHLGGELVDLHILESPKLEKPITKCVLGKRPEVEKISYSGGTVWINKAQTEGFDGVPEDVWNFYIGGYQVCEKWLKDRKGRVLSKEDLAHYQKIVVALRETIRLMAKIDEVIEKYGGWPGAFALAKT